MNTKETISLNFGSSEEDQTLLRRIFSTARDEGKATDEQVKHLLEMSLGIKAPNFNMWKRLRPHQVAELFKEREEIAKRQAIQQEQSANQN